MLLTKQELAFKALEAAQLAEVPAELVCAIIETSSGWNSALTEWAPSTWLMNQHPTDIGEQNWIAMGTRWGAMQVLGQDAWMAGYKALEKLGETDESLTAGCVALKKILSDDIKKTLQTWFGRERRNLVQRTLAILPQCKAFVEAKPCVNS